MKIVNKIIVCVILERENEIERVIFITIRALSCRIVAWNVIFTYVFPVILLLFRCMFSNQKRKKWITFTSDKYSWRYWLSKKKYYFVDILYSGSDRNYRYTLIQVYKILKPSKVPIATLHVMFVISKWNVNFVNWTHCNDWQWV